MSAIRLRCYIMCSHHTLYFWGFFAAFQLQLSPVRYLYTYVMVQVVLYVHESSELVPVIVGGMDTTHKVVSLIYL